MRQIDLPNSDIPGTTGEVTALLGSEDPLLPVSAKTGEGVNDVLEAIVQYIPAPASTGSQALAALAFDSWYDEFKGVVSLIAVKSGYIKKGEIHLHLAFIFKAEVVHPMLDRRSNHFCFQ